MMEEVGMIMAFIGLGLFFAGNMLLHLGILSDSITILSVTTPIINLVSGFGMIFIGTMIAWVART